MRLKRRFFKPLRPLLCAVLPLMAARIACAEPAPDALPTGFASSGNVSAVTSGSALTVTQNEARVIIDWQSFDIGRDARADFVQPDSRSIAVNRVNNSSGDPSQIYGQLNANGTVVILDRNGIIFGAGAKVDTSGIVAASGTLANPAAFLSNGNLVFGDIAANPAARISNGGEITVRGAGLAAFVAPQVHNSGIIRARLGTVILASGETATLDMHGDGLWSIAVTGSLAGDITRLHNSGVIDADGGAVYLNARTAQSAANKIVNNTGVISAQRFAEKDGKIILSTAVQSAERRNAAMAGTDSDLQGVLDSAAADGSSTLYLSGGDYNGSYTVSRTLKLASDNPDRMPHLISGDESPALRIAADNVEIEGLKITGGLYAEAVQGFKLSLSALAQGASGVSGAMTLVRTTGAYIAGNYFTHYGEGAAVRLQQTADTVFDANYFLGSADAAISSVAGSRLGVLASNIFAGIFGANVISSGAAAAIDDSRTTARPAPVSLPKTEAEIIIVDANSANSTDAAALAALSPAAGDAEKDCTGENETCH